MGEKFRWGAAALLLFLVVVTDFTGRFMSMLVDGVFVVGVVYLLWPLVRKNFDV